MPAATPQRLGPNGRWRPGRAEQWLTFGPRASQLTGGPFRATTPGNALLNYLYAVLESEMTIALLAAGLDPGIGMFHVDTERPAKPPCGRSAITNIGCGRWEVGLTGVQPYERLRR